jgi:hypothetical protein
MTLTFHRDIAPTTVSISVTAEINGENVEFNFNITADTLQGNSTKKEDGEQKNNKEEENKGEDNKGEENKDSPISTKTEEAVQKPPIAEPVVQEVEPNINNGMFYNYTYFA